VRDGRASDAERGSNASFSQRGARSIVRVARRCEAWQNICWRCGGRFV